MQAQVAALAAQAQPGFQVLLGAGTPVKVQAQIARNTQTGRGAALGQGHDLFNPGQGEVLQLAAGGPARLPLLRGPLAVLPTQAQLGRTGMAQAGFAGCQAEFGQVGLSLVSEAQRDRAGQLQLPGAG